MPAEPEVDAPRERELMRPENVPGDAREPRPLLKRVAWLALIWAASVAALGVVSLLLRWWLK